jgi:hypothetical protein
MTFDQLLESIARDAAPPAKVSLALQALWHDARRDWDRAHQCAQQARSRDGDWVHAYLHRKEGDLGNAGYWYLRASKPVPAASLELEAEWANIARALLEQQQAK